MNYKLNRKALKQVINDPFYKDNPELIDGVFTKRKKTIKKFKDKKYEKDINFH